MFCNNCNGPSNCCYVKAKELKLFKKKMLNHFILEVIFEMVISISSVVTDILTIIIYLQRKDWILAMFTFIPVLLPTTVFTNVYLSDERSKSANNSGVFVKACDEGQTESECHQCETPVESLQHVGRCYGCRVCCRGCFLSFCNEDRDIRKGGAKIVKKYLRRTSKYLFGTLVLRVIAWTWYLKALIFGFKALRAPKRYMKMQSPDTHWSHELLLRLDFLQAALENAPQCVIQLYALLVSTDENVTLGILTLTFSFLDFIRVATTVHWNIEKGPVEAPSHINASIMWRTINMSSWILLYVARCCAVALIIATNPTSESWGILIAFGVLILHMCLFAKLFSSKKFGVAAEKIFVTAFISLFFLPELDAVAVDVLIQFYYAILLLENTCFIMPWKGLDYNYCELFSSSKSNPNSGITTTPTIRPRNSEMVESTTENAEATCFIQAELVVLVVASFTVLGVILRLAAARRTSRHQATLPEEERSTTMEEKIAKIYNRKWTTMTLKDLLNSFLHMLRKEVIVPDRPTKTTTTTNTSLQTSSSAILISDQLATHFTASQNFIKKSFSMFIRNPDEVSTMKSRRSSFVDKTCTNTELIEHGSNLSGKYSLKKEKFNDHVDNLNNDEAQVVVPKLFFVPAYPRNSTSHSFSSLRDTFPL